MYWTLHFSAKISKTINYQSFSVSYKICLEIDLIYIRVCLQFLWQIWRIWVQDIYVLGLKFVLQFKFLLLVYSRDKFNWVCIYLAVFQCPLIALSNFEALGSHVRRKFTCCYENFPVQFNFRITHLDGRKRSSTLFWSVCYKQKDKMMKINWNNQLWKFELYSSLLI